MLIVIPFIYILLVYSHPLMASIFYRWVSREACDLWNKHTNKFAVNTCIIKALSYSIYRFFFKYNNFVEIYTSKLIIKNKNKNKKKSLSTKLITSNIDKIFKVIKVSNFQYFVLSNWRNIKVKVTNNQQSDNNNTNVTL